MNCEIVSVGDEVVGGRVTDTNAAWLAQRLAEVGLFCLKHVAVTDDVGAIAEAVSAAAFRVAVVIVSGGLGPTQDDVTREGIARAAGVSLRPDEQRRAAVEPRDAHPESRPQGSAGREDARAIGVEHARQGLERRQSLLPAGATGLANTVGTAPGLRLALGKCIVYALPGVPVEMERMFLDEVLPDLRRRGMAREPLASRVLRVAGEREAAVAARLADVWPAPGDCLRMALLAAGGEVQVRVSLAADAAGRSDCGSGADMLDEAEAQVRARLGVSVYGGASDRLETVVGDLLVRQGRTVATAESLTGGALAARLVSVVGASTFYRGGAVTYATDTKVTVLGVGEAMIHKEGVVSEAVALAMAHGARERFGADVGLATTGVAGPASSDGIPAGTVWVALADGERAAAWNVRFLGTREQVIRRTVAVVLDKLRRHLTEAALP